MGKESLQCLFIGESTKDYRNIVRLLNEFNLNLQVKRVDAEKALVSKALKRQRAASLVFIADDVSFSLELLSDLVWQYSADSIVTILTVKNVDSSLEMDRQTRFSTFHYVDQASESRLHLQYLIQSAQLKWEFRHCKRLLGVSETRSQWLIDSSHQAIAYVLRDFHLYANTAYLGLFNIDSLYELPSIPLQNIFVDDEYVLFERFLKKQNNTPHINRSLIISLRKRNGHIFRANIYLIPSVFKGKKCMQLWVHPLNLAQQKNEADKTEKQNKIELSMSNVKKKNKGVVKKQYSENTILKSILRRKEATISAQQLVNIQINNKSGEINHILSLRVPAAQRVGIENLLSDLGGANVEQQRQIFWDKVKLARLLQVLIKKKNLGVMLFIRLSEAAVNEKKFNNWLKLGLRKITSKSSNLTFLLSAHVNEDNKKSFLSFVSMLRSFDCQVGLDDFSVSGDSLYLLKHIKPDFVRLSLSWVRQIEGNEKRELALASFIRQLEEREIRVIAPRGFSKEMKKLFALSGASFCQERTPRNA